LSGFLDTSVVVRYLTGDPPAMAAAARSIIELGKDLILTEAVIAEIAFVLEDTYRVPRPETVENLTQLLLRQNIRVYGRDKKTVVFALQMCSTSRRVSYVDALLWAAAGASETPTVYTFDQRFPDNNIRTSEALEEG